MVLMVTVARVAVKRFLAVRTCAWILPCVYTHLRVELNTLKAY